MPPFNAPSCKTMVASVGPDAEFAGPATETLPLLSVHLPEKFRQLLLEFDGLIADCGADVVWSVAKLGQRNQQFRTEKSFRELYMPFDHLWFFGADGGGDPKTFLRELR